MQKSLVKLLLSASLIAMSLGLIPARAQTNFQKCFSFGPSPVNGSSPQGALVQAADGFIYGVTAYGGSNQCGTVYKFLPDTTGFTAIHHFASPTIGPVSGVTIGPDNLLYGTVPMGGISNAGVIFRVGRDGANYSVLHEFEGTPEDGTSPLGVLLLNDGFLYGTTAGGGISNVGTIYRIHHTGSQYEILHHFTGTLGSLPSAGLLAGQDGLLYGTARRGGSANQGLLFKIAQNGTGFNVVMHFPDEPQSAKEPVSRLIQDGDGSIYGTTLGGGIYGAGTVYKVNTNGTGFTILYHARYGANNGAQPLSALMLTNGFLYSTTLRGGANNGGVAFRLRTDGSDFSILRDFSAAFGDGAQPYSPLLMASNGMLYGSTYSGGDYAVNGASGILYRLSNQPFPGRLTASKIGANTGLIFQGGNGDTVYDIERTIQLGSAASWQVIGTTNTTGLGNFYYEDSFSSGSAFYRTVKH